MAQLCAKPQFRILNGAPSLDINVRPFYGVALRASWYATEEWRCVRLGMPPRSGLAWVLVRKGLRPKTLLLMALGRNKTTGAQLQITINIPVNFHDCKRNTLGDICTTKCVTDRQTDRQPCQKQLLAFGRNNTTGAQLQIPINIPVDFHDSK